MDFGGVGWSFLVVGGETSGGGEWELCTRMESKALNKQTWVEEMALGLR